MQEQLVCRNKRINFDYEIISSYEAGMCLLGTEVKALRLQGGNISESYCTIYNNIVTLHEMHIPKYKNAHSINHREKRGRFLLLKMSQIKKIHGNVKQNHLTIIPEKVYFNKNNLAKIKICICKKRKQISKKEYIKEREERKTFKIDYN